MNDIFQKVADFGVCVMEMAKYLKEEGKDFPLIARVLECVSGICGSLRSAITIPKHSQGFYVKVIGFTEEFQYLMELMVKSGVLTELQSKPLISDSQAIKDETVKLIGKKQ
jgi:hypothetical protein